MKQIKDPLTCSRCGCVDQNDDSVIPHHIGTSVRMKCADCAGEDGHATLCRKCCPSEHQTKFNEDEIATLLEDHDEWSVRDA